MKVKCPACGREAVFDATNPCRPFCSERCQTLDLGAWADERYRVPSPESVSNPVNEKSDSTRDDADDFPLKRDLN